MQDAFGRKWVVTGDGVTYAAGGLTIQANTAAQAMQVAGGMAPDGWSAQVATVTTIQPLAFLQRFTPAEQTALMTAAASNVAMNLWVTKAAAAESIDVT